jgi:protease PrsW
MFPLALVIFPHALQLILAQASISVFPVLIFLFALELIDTYKLLTLGRVLRSVAVGCAAAAVCYAINTGIYAAGVPPSTWARSGAPVIEELAKALYIVWLLRSNRMGFMVDTAISGFAVGAGFAVLENLTYIPDLSASGLVGSAIRGLGTAMMHGGATAIFGTVAVNLSETRGPRSAAAYLPGLAMAIAIHELYNQPWWRPVMAAVVVLVMLPVAITFIFWRSEQVLANWLGMKLDKDIDLLQMIASRKFGKTRAGKYMRSLENTFAPVILGDMLSYLHLSLELSARAKGDLLRREMGFPVTPDPELPGEADRPRGKDGLKPAPGAKPAGCLGAAAAGGEDGFGLAAAGFSTRMHPRSFGDKIFLPGGSLYAHVVIVDRPHGCLGSRHRYFSLLGGLPVPHRNEGRGHADSQRRRVENRRRAEAAPGAPATHPALPSLVRLGVSRSPRHRGGDLAL